MTENEITQGVIGCAIEVHRYLGPGLLESVYEDALCYELSRAGLTFQRQAPVPIIYKETRLATPLKLDLRVEEKVVIENKSKLEVTRIDRQQLLTYLRLLDLRVGLLINFNVLKLVEGVHRIVNNLKE